MVAYALGFYLVAPYHVTDHGSGDLGVSADHQRELGDVKGRMLGLGPLMQQRARRRETCVPREVPVGTQSEQEA